MLRVLVVDIIGSLAEEVELVDLAQPEEEVVVQEVLILEQVMVEMDLLHQQVHCKTLEVVEEVVDIQQQILQVMLVMEATVVPV